MATGVYSIVITGDNLGKAEIYITYNHGEKTIDSKTVEYSQQTVVLNVEVKSDLTGCECVIRNHNEEEIKIFSIRVLKE